MAVSLEKFIKQLEESGVLSGDTLHDFLPPNKTPKDAEELARQKKLTKFQVEQVSKGKGKWLTLGKYLLLEKIGAGGMGQVFKARAAQHPVEERSSPEWNHLVIVLQARQLTTSVNGTEVSSFDSASLSASNKPVTVLQRTSGRIGLQSNAGTVRFRNLQILELKTSTTSASTPQSADFQKWLKDVVKRFDEH